MINELEMRSQESEIWFLFIKRSIIPHLFTQEWYEIRWLSVRQYRPWGHLQYFGGALLVVTMFKGVLVALSGQKPEDLVITPLCGSVLPCKEPPVHHMTSVSLAGNSCT